MALLLFRCLQVGCCCPPTCMVAVAGGGGLGMGESLATFTVDMVTLVGVLLGAAGVCVHGDVRTYETERERKRERERVRTYAEVSGYFSSHWHLQWSCAETAESAELQLAGYTRCTNNSKYLYN